MNKPTHVIGGITAGIAVNTFIVPELAIDAESVKYAGLLAIMGGAYLGSLLPDIDHQGSFIGRRVKMLSFLIQKTAGHRGLTHAPIFTIGLITILSLLVLQLSGFAQQVMLLFVLGLGSGMLSHLLLDSLTKGGIPLFYPFSKKKVSFASFKTGGIGEYIVSFACLLLIVFMLQDFLLLFLAQQ